MIAIDVDSTLYSFEKVAREEFFNLALETGDESYLKGAYTPWTEWRSPADANGLDAWLAVIDRCHDADRILEQDPFPLAAQTLQELVDQGHSLIYVSDRASESATATEQWLRAHNFPEQELVCTRDKTPWLSQCRYLIDDRPKTLIEFVYDFVWKNSKGSGPTNQRMAFGLAYPYNQALTDVPNIFLAPGQSWAGIRYYLIKKNVLKEPAYA